MGRMIHPIIVPMRFVLASASPRRAELLRAAGYEFETLIVDLDERVRPGEAPDIYVNSLLDPGTDEVAAFEGLVGCHGGLGGWQDRACAVVPVDVPFPEERVVGADAMHVALRDILRHLGHRQGITEPGEES